MTKEERDLLLVVSQIVLANHNNSGPAAMSQRSALRKALVRLRDADLPTFEDVRGILSPDREGT